ncbi:hypothetical protein BHM03_00012293 [Ensete ventricosum]|uniref:Protein phosphatase n=1 Tax=Ensete ventricosum TaxID=4639 RepID=A0A427B484_ENSVE|nr:hypothetical protein B296_00001335 [Ensete ventricosum]RZR85333.1 hypothetical protein BHM03_00012293 [Ensete ventricosum]
MPSTYLPKHKGLQTSSELLRSRGRSFLFGNTCFVLSEPFSALGSGFHLLSRSSSSACDRRTTQSGIGALLRSVNNQLSQPAQGFPFRWSIMSASSAFLRGSDSFARHLAKDNARSGNGLSGVMRVDIGYSYKGLDHCRRVSGSLKNREPWGTNMIYKCFWSDAYGLNWRSKSLVEPGSQDYQTSCTAPYSAGVAPDVSLDAAMHEEQLQTPDLNSEQYVPGHFPLSFSYFLACLLGDRFLKLRSGSCYLPHPNKEETGGEDAHFICVNEQVIGVADGVGGWADLGVDAGQYARELMSNSVNAIQEEPKGSVDPARVLDKAYSITKARGSSTACIIALTDQVFTFLVASGDVIIAGTDGLFDNLYNNEITAVVVHATRAGLGPQVTAQKIAALARQRALDKTRQTPFSTAAQDAGYRYHGGKLDDITVVVSYVTASDA